MNSIKIRCPKCKWEPDDKTLWQCSCGHRWNTFATGGRCPACKKLWEDTQCIIPKIGGCSKWSPHLDWYENLDNVVKEIKEVVEEKLPVHS